MAYSLHQRPELLQRLRSEVFDLLVVGGGITGAGIARDAALRGLKVALVERGDFAIGTSSRSSKLIHGGLRYLEMGDVGLVFEAVRERQRLIHLAPHLARPQSFVVPVFEHSKRSVFALDVGLTIYDLLAAFAGVMRHRAVRRKALIRLEPLLHQQGLAGGVRYYDAMTDDGRLVIANIRGAWQAGAVPVSRVSFLEPVLKNNRVISARVRDEVRGESLLVACKCIVAAAGPWTDEFMSRFKGQPVPPSLRPSKGVHVVLPRERLPLSQAVLMTAADGRVVFALPWPDATVLGTTDTPYEGSFDDPPTTWDDAQYLVDTANAHFDAPGGPLQVADVVATWAGIRPLVANAPGQSSYKTSREHVVTTDPRGLVVIAGGKLTTYRIMAAEAVDAALRLLPQATAAEAKPCATQQLPLPGAVGMPGRTRPLETLVTLLAGKHRVAPELARHLAWQYGTEAESVLKLAGAMPDGLTPVLPGLPVLWGELRWIVQEEMAMTLVDLTVRRSQLYYLAGERLLLVADELARRMAEWCGLPASRAPTLSAELVDHVVRHRVQPQVPPAAGAARSEASHVA